MLRRRSGRSQEFLEIKKAKLSMPKEPRSPLARYGMAVIASFAALGLRLLLGPVLKENAPLLVFIMPVMFSAWYGGFGPGMLATALSALVGCYFFITPMFSPTVDGLANTVRVTIFLVEGVLISTLSQALHNQRNRAGAIAHSLQESEERYRMLVEGVQDYAIFGLDPEGYIVSWNLGAERIKGYTAAEILGQHFSRFYSPEELEQGEAEKHLQQARAEGRISYEGLRLRKDGSQFWGTFVLTALRDAAGNLRGFSKVTRDITAQKAAEESLHRLARRLETLHEIDLAILSSDSLEDLAQTSLTRLRDVVPYQRAWVVLFDSEQSQAHVLAQVDADPQRSDEATASPETVELTDGLPPELLEGDSATVIDDCPPISDSLFPQETHNCITVPLRTDDASIGMLTLAALASVSFDQEHREIAQEIASQLAIAIQQTRLREELHRNALELEQRVEQRTAELQEANAELEAFGYSVSHDLRAPLRAMQGFAQALLEDYGNELNAEAQSYIDRIVFASQRMSTLIEDLLAYSRLSRTDLGLYAVSLESVIAEVRGQLEAEIQLKRAQILVEEPLPLVLANRLVLVQVIANLLTNAMKFVAEGTEPQIRIWAEEREQGVRLWIQDNGIGIAKEYQERIFRVFERLHGIETYPGTGIGLAIARKGLERMGGSIGVVSQPGQGSRFWLELQKP